MRNVFKELVELLAPTASQVGTVVAIADGVATIELPGGGTLRARGSASVDQLVFVRDGLIESTAPALPIIEGEV